MARTHTKQEEVDRNYKAFKDALPELAVEHSGKYALLHNREIVEFFDSARDAMVYGAREYKDGLFSVQEVTEQVADLGFYSHAVLDSTI